MPADPKTQPIAALLERWRNTVRVYEKAAEKQPEQRQYWLQMAVTAKDTADEIEAAIKAQCEVWAARRSLAFVESCFAEGHAYETAIRELKGEP